MEHHYKGCTSKDVNANSVPETTRGNAIGVNSCCRVFWSRPIPFTK